MDEIIDVDQSEKRRKRWQAFNLVYLLFYFTQWFWVPPTIADIIAIAIAIAIFLPIFFSSFEKHEPRYLLHIAAFEVIALCLSPFSGSQGVFHVYACVQAGYQRPAKRGLILLASLTVGYGLLGFLLNFYWPAVLFSMFLGVVTGLSCSAAASGLERGRALRRAQVLEQQRAALAERERIAHDLHDLLGQTLTTVALKSEVAHKLIDKDPARAKVETAEVAEAARNALSEIRAAVYDMTATTVEQEIERAKQALSAAGVTLEISDDIPPLDPTVSKALGLTIREATTNIVRHANATQARIAFRYDGETLEVVVRDNGQGALEDMKEGAGLSGLRKRVRALGGKTAIRMQSGTEVRISLPFEHSGASA
ncbi:MAG: sensor histidine kinase [Pseudomonadota bacterium]